MGNGQEDQTEEMRLLDDNYVGVGVSGEWVYLSTSQSWKDGTGKEWRENECEFRLSPSEARLIALELKAKAKTADEREPKVGDV